jgi:ribosomal protein S18 acetylase RimI-like enzyme
VTVRPVRWSEDDALLAVLDTSFTTDRVYRVDRSRLGFTLVEQRIDPPLRKDYRRVTDDLGLREMDCVRVAQDGERLVGFAAAEYASWNRRLLVRHLYVASESRGSGVGRALLEQVEAFARSAGARCLWVETQNVNYPAVRFYQRAGFRLCGLDESLYDPAGPGGDDVALFFVREVVQDGVRV